MVWVRRSRTNFKHIRGVVCDHGSTRTTDELRTGRVRIYTTIAELSPKIQCFISHLKQMRIFFLTSVTIVMFGGSGGNNWGQRRQLDHTIPWVVDSINGDGSAGPIRRTTTNINSRGEYPPFFGRDGSHRQRQEQYDPIQLTSNRLFWPYLSS